MARSGTLRDVLILLGVFGLLLGGLYLYAGVWPPAVIVESGSMMHPDDEVTYGRVGTIDPGDLVIVKAADGVEGVRTFVEGGDGTYGLPGDVIVYYSANDRRTTPIIHRAMAHVDRVGSGDDVQYRVRWGASDCPPSATREGDACVWGREGITLNLDGHLRLTMYKPTKSGFVTKGDNPSTNAEADQISGLSRDASGPVPVQPAWIEGKARGELPWLGLIKLALAPQYNQPDCAADRYHPQFHFMEESPTVKCQGWYALGRAYAPKDLWVMLGVSLFVLVGLPMIYDVLKNRRAKRAPPAQPAAGPEAGPADGEQRL